MIPGLAPQAYAVALRVAAEDAQSVTGIVYGQIFPVGTTFGQDFPGGPYGIVPLPLVRGVVPVPLAQPIGPITVPRSAIAAFIPAVIPGTFASSPAGVYQQQRGGVRAIQAVMSGAPPGFRVGQLAASDLLASPMLARAIEELAQRLGTTPYGEAPAARSGIGPLFGPGAYVAPTPQEPRPSPGAPQQNGYVFDPRTGRYVRAVPLPPAAAAVPGPISAPGPYYTPQRGGIAAIYSATQSSPGVR
jgi:hypothetical protein